MFEGAGAVRMLATTKLTMHLDAPVENLAKPLMRGDRELQFPYHLSWQ